MIVFPFKGENGQGMAEYGLVLALIAAVAAVAIGIFGQRVLGLYENADAVFP